jgi:hypothetical protein
MIGALHRTAQIQRLSLDTAAFGHHFQSEVPTKFTGGPHQMPKRHKHKAITWTPKELWAKVTNESLERTNEDRGNDRYGCSALM